MPTHWRHRPHIFAGVDANDTYCTSAVVVNLRVQVDLIKNILQ